MFYKEQHNSHKKRVLLDCDLRELLLAEELGTEPKIKKLVGSDISKKVSILTPTNTFCVLQRTTEQPQEKRLLDCDLCELLLRFLRPVGLIFVIFFSISVFLEYLRSRSTGGKLSKLTGGTSSCLSRRVVLITRVIEVFCSSMDSAILCVLP